MYVCICRAVTESQIEAAIAQGAQSVRDLRDALGIVDECGRCAVCALECLNGARTGGHCSAASTCPPACVNA